MKKVIVISAINLRSGGTLSILNDCLEYLDRDLSNKYKVIALVHDKKILKSTKSIEYIEFPLSVKSYIYRLYYEYIYFKKLSLKLNPYLWFSLHDITPNVKTEVQAVYCHNPTPFYKISFSEVLVDKKFAFFCWFYKYLYKINIVKNDFVVVQQEWMRKKFFEMYNVKECVVSYPFIDIEIKNYQNSNKGNNKKVFFYPSFPRVFKNFEVICEAVKLLNERSLNGFEVIITINGQENKYSKFLLEKYRDVENIHFIGLQSRDRVFELYSTVNCLIFPSKLETWGLPISEFKEFKKPMFLADLEYAHAALGSYETVKYFTPSSPEKLSALMENFIKNDLILEKNKVTQPERPFTSSWKELFTVLLKGNINEKH